jgi:hypothetical protein
VTGVAALDTLAGLLGIAEFGVGNITDGGVDAPVVAVPGIVIGEGVFTTVSVTLEETAVFSE